MIEANVAKCVRLMHRIFQNMAPHLVRRFIQQRDPQDQFPSITNTPSLCESQTYTVSKFGCHAYPAAGVFLVRPVWYGKAQPVWCQQN